MRDLVNREIPTSKGRKENAVHQIKDTLRKTEFAGDRLFTGGVRVRDGRYVHSELGVFRVCIGLGLCDQSPPVSTFKLILVLLPPLLPLK